NRNRNRITNLCDDHRNCLESNREPDGRESSQCKCRPEARIHPPGDVLRNAVITCITEIPAHQTPFGSNLQKEEDYEKTESCKGRSDRQMVVFALVRLLTWARRKENQKAHWDGHGCKRPICELQSVFAAQELGEHKRREEAAQSKTTMQRAHKRA